MSTKSETNVKLLDCTIRDGGYLNNWQFDKKLVRETFRALAKAGADYFEIGFRGTEKHFDKSVYGPWRFSSCSDIKEVCSGIHGPKIAVMGDFGKIDIEDFEPAAESPVDLVRIAAHKHTMADALKFVDKVKALGYETSIQAMGYSGYTAQDKQELVRMLSDSQVDIAYVADSYGSIFPDQIEGMFEPLQVLKGRVRLGFHPHNSLQMAFANSIEAIKCGVDIIDSSIFGMGRGAGNLPTEIILAYLDKLMPGKFNVIPVLDAIDKYFINMQKEINWGYQLPYMLSGLFQCHPTYARKLVSMREYTIEDVWRILDAINRKNPVGYSDDILKEIVAQGLAGPTLDEKAVAQKPAAPEAAAPSNVPPPDVPYIDRHKGRTFLVLANGPTLMSHHEQIRAFIEKHDPVVLGANYLAGMFKPQYHAFNNKRRLTSYISAVAQESTLLIGQYIPEAMVREYTDRNYETLYYLDTLKNNFDIKDGVIQTNCRSVSVLLLGLSIVMGAEQIFAAGMDGYLNMDEKGTPLFYRETEEKEEQDLLVQLHRQNDMYIEQINNYFHNMGKDGVHILTPTSHGKFYKGILNYI